MGKRGPKAKVNKEVEDMIEAADDPILLIVSEASADLEEAIEMEDIDEAWEKINHASGLLKGTVLILRCSKDD